MASRREGKSANVGSVTVAAPGPWACAYTASKAALHGYTHGCFKCDHGCTCSNKVKHRSSALAGYNQMPEWKLYKPIEAAIRPRATLSQGPKSTPSEDFANKTGCHSPEESTSFVLLRSPLYHFRHLVSSATLA